MVRVFIYTGFINQFTYTFACVCIHKPLLNVALLVQSTMAQQLIKKTKGKNINRNKENFSFCT